jgi:GTP cyclohydrolase I/GTP cyclohydrolase-4
MKRSDEAAVIDKAHRRPRTAEDCVQAMLAGVVAQFPDVPGDVYVYAAQEHVETLRAHHLVVERAARLGDLR